jgi:hypothetical protein
MKGLTADDRERIQMTEGLVNDGRASRRAGFKIDQCPPFRFEDWADDWRRGWRLEDEVMKDEARRR